MTRKEAVSIIEERVRVTEYVESSYVDCVDIEALRIAIKALTQPEIILCEDCEYWERESCVDGFCNESWIHVDEDHYCGFAKRREE